MVYDYFASDEFQELLSLYNKNVREGNSYYFDIDDFISLSDYFVEIGDINQAEEILKKAICIHPESKNIKVAYAGILICNYKFNQAKEHINDVTEDDCYDVLYLQAQLACAVEHDYIKSNNLFHNWIDYIDEEFDDEEDIYDHEELDPDEEYDYSSKNRDARFRIIMSFSEFMDKNELSRTYIREWLEDYTTKFSKLGRFREDYDIAETCYDLGLYDILDDIISQILDINPYYEQGWTMLGISQHLRGDDSKAINSLKFALAINPDNRLANLTYAQCMFNKQNYDQALQYMLKSAALSDDLTQDYYIGKCYYKLGNTEKADYYLDKVYQSFKQGHHGIFNDDFSFDLAESLFACSKIEQSQYILLNIINRNPSHINARLLLACIHLHNGAFYDAVEIFTDIIVKSNYDELIITDVASRLVAYDYNDIAIFILKTIIHDALKTGNYKAYAILAISFIKENKPNECLEYLKILCEHSPETVKTYFYTMLPESVLPTDYFEYLSQQLKNHKTNY